MEQEIVVVLPVYNEASTLPWVLEAVRKFWEGEVLVVDDGSADATPRLARAQGAEVFRHEKNRGYGAAVRSGLEWALDQGYRWAITLDADCQHEPSYLPRFLERILAGKVDVVSGSRYLDPRLAQGPVPEDRRWVNRIVTHLIREITGYPITDTFCGFRAWRLQPVVALGLREEGYAFPVEFWIKAAARRLKVEEIAVPLVYYDFPKGVGKRPPQERLAEYLRAAREALLWTC
jgi:dolichol-phosphate mannosyltransferase